MKEALDNAKEELSIDILKEYYETVKNFINYVEMIVEEKEED